MAQKARRIERQNNKKVLIRNASGNFKENILNASVGLVAGYFSKLLFEGVTNSPIKKLPGSVLMFGITNIVAKNPDTIKSPGKKFLNITRSKPGELVNGSGQSQTR